MFLLQNDTIGLIRLVKTSDSPNPSYLFVFMSSFQAHFALDQLEQIFSNLGTLPKMSDIEAFFQEMFAKCRPLKKGQIASQSANLDAGISRAFGHFRCVKDPLSFHKLSKHFVSPRFVKLVGAWLGPQKEENMSSFETKDSKKGGALSGAGEAFKASTNKGPSSQISSKLTEKLNLSRSKSLEWSVQRPKDRYEQLVRNLCTSHAHTGTD